MNVNASVGTLAVALGFASSAVGVITIGVGLRTRQERMLRAGRAYTFLALGGAVAAFLIMERALLTHDFSLRYVANNGSRATPTIYTFASLWGALEGSIILWTLILGVYTVLVGVRFRSRVT
ncbi:MAG TPA: hypothetical protein VKJ07_05980, partial [Mycobacteriales bacterium]|nr:hypothetical protein [Mycobacteriales bacterium]